MDTRDYGWSEVVEDHALCRELGAKSLGCSIRYSRSFQNVKFTLFILLAFLLVYNTTKTVCMLVQPKKSQGRYSTRVGLGKEELSYVNEFRYTWLQTVEMIKILKNNSGGKMQLAICWAGSSNLHLRRQKSNSSSYIVTQFMDVLIGVIHSTTLL